MSGELLDTAKAFKQLLKESPDIWMIPLRDIVGDGISLVGNEAEKMINKPLI